MKNRLILFSFLMLPLLSCDRVDVFREPSAYMSYSRKLNLSATGTNKTLLYKASIVPTEMLAIQNNAPIDSIEAYYGNKVEIVLEITDSTSHKDLLDLFPPNSPEYGRILNYYSVGIRDHVRLVADADTFYPMYANPVRTYGILKNNPIVLGFDLNQPIRNYNNVEVFYFDALFYKEDLILSFSESDIDKTPKLSR